MTTNEIHYRHFQTPNMHSLCCCFRKIDVLGNSFDEVPTWTCNKAFTRQHMSNVWETIQKNNYKQLLPFAIIDNLRFFDMWHVWFLVTMISSQLIVTLLPFSCYRWLLFSSQTVALIYIYTYIYIDILIFLDDIPKNILFVWLMIYIYMSYISP